MAELPHLYVISGEDLSQRQEQRLITPLHADEGLRVVDCGDWRPLTPESAQQRSEDHGQDVMSGRYFGAVSGLALSGLVVLASQTGEKFMSDFFKEYSPEAMVDFAADLSDRAHNTGGGLDLTYHSAEPNEGNAIEIGHDHSDHGNPLGCKFLALMGHVLDTSARQATLEESAEVAGRVGIDLPLEEVRQGVQILRRHMPQDFTIPRSALRQAVYESSRHTPVAILEDSQPPTGQTAMVYDLGGYRSDARAHAKAGLPRYHHTPHIAAELLPSLLPEYNFDKSLLTASALLIGSATRFALSGEQTPQALKAEIIPPGYAATA